VRRRHKGQ